MNANIPQEFNNFFLKDVSFVNLMTKRIFNVLIVANPYDAFMLEDDGRIDEKLFDEYSELGMRYPPSFTQVSTTEEADIHAGVDDGGGRQRAEDDGHRSGDLYAG